jgi:hypothetical protein
MKPIFIALAVFICAFFLTNSFAQVKVNGWLQSNLYVLENDLENQQWDFYQGLQFRVTSKKYSKLYFNTFMRLAYRGDPAEWQEKAYNLYLNWVFAKNYRVRVGRMFYYKGVINGTIDAGEFAATFGRNLRINAVVGTETPFNRKFEIRNWDNGNVIGGYLSYRLPWKNKIDVSYFQKQRFSELYWQIFGSTLQGYLGNYFNYYLRYDYDILKSDYQQMRYRLTFNKITWSLGVEYNAQQPRIYEDSYFAIFQVDAYRQIRAIGTYWVGNFELGLQYLYTIYDNDNDNRIIASLGTRKYGNFGIVYQTGFGGENVGYYADLRYEFMNNFIARLYNSYYNFERAFTSISQDALAFRVGLGYRWNNKLMLDGEIQQASNSYYKSDVRGLMRVTYLFQF